MSASDPKLLKIVLFDIDGTLMTTGGGARHVFSRALTEAAGRPVHADGYAFSGRTDPQIARDILSMNSLEGEELERAVPQAVRLYLEYFEQVLPTLPKARLMPGVKELLEALRVRPDAHVGLLTGNVEAGARLKLGHFGIEHYFDFSVSCFGSDHEDRYQLPALALERARRALGPGISGNQIVLVGDSEHDVLCGRSIGARCVAVSTGVTPAEKLLSLAPHVHLRDLSDMQGAVTAILH
jgi:phosphoglycolate phosphatase-like HAD superfamily hydrolase